jgi:hypothetical protein
MPGCFSTFSGPGAYDPKELHGKVDPKSGFLTGDRFASGELEGMLHLYLSMSYWPSAKYFSRYTISNENTGMCRVDLPTGGDTQQSDLSPPRERKKPDTSQGRNFSWATQRIHELTQELEALKAKCKVL